MSKEFAQTFYHSKEWKSCRESYISKRRMIDGGMCEKCHKRLGYIVHHKTKITPANIGDPDITLNHCNLEYECKQCHDEEEGHFLDRDLPKLKCLFDTNGQPILPPSNET